MARPIGEDEMQQLEAMERSEDINGRLTSVIGSLNIEKIYLESELAGRNKTVESLQHQLETERAEKEELQRQLAALLADDKGEEE